MRPTIGYSQTMIEPTKPNLTSRGYTLIELSIVIGIMSIIAGVVVPDVIEMVRNRLGERVAREATYIMDAARWAYVATSSTQWPGQTAPGTCTEVGAPWALTSEGQLVGGNYLTASQLTNPWGTGYNLTVIDNGGNCYFGLSTCIPTDLIGPFVSYLPYGQCGAGPCGGGCGGGSTRCCTQVIGPGYTTSLNNAITTALAGQLWDNICGMAWHDAGGTLIHGCQGFNPRWGCPADFHQVCDFDLDDSDASIDLRLGGANIHKHDISFSHKVCFCAHDS